MHTSRVDAVREKLAQLGISEEDVEDAVRWPRNPRAGWDQQFRAMAAHGDDQLLDALTPTDGEQNEWE